MTFPENLPEPWYWDATDLTDQLRIEIPHKHALAKAKVKSIARRQDMDDVLFEIENGDYKYAVVHLTWSQHQQKSPYPNTRLYKDSDDLYNNKILLDAEDWKNNSN